jgi:hypothetical protein
MVHFLRPNGLAVAQRPEHGRNRVHAAAATASTLLAVESVGTSVWGMSTSRARQAKPQARLCCPPRCCGPTSQWMPFAAQSTPPARRTQPPQESGAVAWLATSSSLSRRAAGVRPFQHRVVCPQLPVLPFQRGALTAGTGEVARHAHRHRSQALHPRDQLGVLREHASLPDIGAQSAPGRGSR